MEEKKGSHLYYLYDSFHLSTMRSVNSNIKLLQCSKKVKLLQSSKLVILSKYYKSYHMRVSQSCYIKSTSFTVFLTYLKNNFLFSYAARLSLEYFPLETFVFIIKT